MFFVVIRLGCACVCFCCFVDGLCCWKKKTKVTRGSCTSGNFTRLLGRLKRGMVVCCFLIGARVLFRMVGWFCLYYVCHIKKVVSMTQLWYGCLLRSDRYSSAFLDRLLVCSALASFLFGRCCRC